MRYKYFLWGVFPRLCKNIESFNINEDHVQEMWEYGLQHVEAWVNQIYCCDLEHKKSLLSMLINAIIT